MNNELEQIIIELESKLEKLDQGDDYEYQLAREKVIKLQTELLSASYIGKPQLENKLKSELKQAELSLFALQTDKQELEQAYLYKYIKERYD